MGRLSDGFLDYGGRPAWRDQLSSLTAGRAVGVNAPTWSTFRDDISGYAFSASAMNEVWTVMHINHDIKVEAPIYPHVHWSPNTTSTGTVRWGIEFTYAQGHGVDFFPASTTIYLEETISSDKQYTHFVTEVADDAAIVDQNIIPDTLMLFRTFRDAAHANDTFPDPVFGWFLDLHYQIARAGTKNKSPDFYK